MTNPSERKDHDGELIASVPADPLRVAFGAAIEALMNYLGDCPARAYAVREIIEAETRTRHALVRRILN